jgi:hypothetical protein
MVTVASMEKAENSPASIADTKYASLRYSTVQ